MHAAMPLRVRVSCALWAIAGAACSQPQVLEEWVLQLQELPIEWSVRLWDALGPQVAWLLAPGPLLGLLLLNWRAGRDAASEWDEEESARTGEDVVAYPLADHTAPERSGGPSLF